MKPNLAGIATTWSPDSRLSLGTGGFKLHGQQDSGMGNQAKVSGVLTLQMQDDSLPKVRKGFIQRFPLSHHGNLHALGYIVVLAFSHYSLHILLEPHTFPSWQPVGKSFTL